MERMDVSFNDKTLLEDKNGNKIENEKQNQSYLEDSDDDGQTNQGTGYEAINEDSSNSF